MISIKIIVLEMVMFLSVTGVVAQTLTYGFEDSSIWETSNPDNWEISNEKKQSGNYSLKLHLSGTSKDVMQPIICNPIDISYRFQGGSISRREAADPTVILYKDLYYLFASKSGGYWSSTDLATWSYIPTSDLPTEDYAPTAIVLRDTIFFMASSKQPNRIYKSASPLTGIWQIAKDAVETDMWDPAFFLDTDGKLYIYWGCSNREPIYGVELNPVSFDFIGTVQSLMQADREKYGWEVRGDYNDIYDDAPWIEGAWMNKHNGVYYLQYAGPGTQFKSYNDGVYTSSNPLGPFTIAASNPFAYKPEGYACGAGHGSTFHDKYGNLWHAGTVTVSVKHHFERRLAIYPAFYDDDNILFSPTAYGDYPITVPDHKIGDISETIPGWMLLSYNKTVDVSSTDGDHVAANMVNEDIRTYWAAETGNNTEWAAVDLGDTCRIYAIQVNFAEHNTSISYRPAGIKHRYQIELSSDNSNWSTIVDMSSNTTDNTHNFLQLPGKVISRYIRVNNIEVPDGNFAISGLRVFGLGFGAPPAENTFLNITRNSNDKRQASLSWDEAEGAIGYVIRYGIAESKLYLSYMVYDQTSLILNSLSTEQDYYFTIESFNENGITKSDLIIESGRQ